MSVTDKPHSREEWIAKLVDVIGHLRGPEGCPWDRKQTFESLKPYIMEECAEFLDSVDDGDHSGMVEELGDVLLQIALHSQIASESGLFDIYDVAEGICNKMIRRHPHVFGDEVASTAEEVPGLWEKVKAAEKKTNRESVLDGVPRNLPPLFRVHQIQKKAAKTGFEWQDQDHILAKIDEELAEVKDAIAHGDVDHIDEEIGDLLFVIIGLCRFRGGKRADEVLKDSIRKFEGRFRHLETSAKVDSLDLAELSKDELISLWEEAKSAGK